MDPFGIIHDDSEGDMRNSTPHAFFLRFPPSLLKELGVKKDLCAVLAPDRPPLLPSKIWIQPS